MRASAVGSDDPFHLGPLAVWQHTPPEPRARFILVHGISEHSGRHLNTVGALAEKGVEVVRFDLHGAGRSGGRRQYCERFDDYVADTARVFNWVHRELAPLPLFLLGHSLGGAIAVHFAANYGRELRGLVLSAPAFRVGIGISPFKLAVAKLLENLSPGLRIPDASDNHAISRDPEVVKAYREDPLSCHYNTVRQGGEILRALENLPAACRQIETPVLIAHGSADEIIRLDGSFELLGAFRSHDKTFHILPGGFHEPHNDLDKEEYLQLVTRWVTKRLALC